MAEDGRILDGPRVARRPHLDKLSQRQSFDRICRLGMSVCRRVCVMNHATKAIEVEDIEARVAELERAPQMRGNSQ
jgi:hypothetical protein